MEGDKDRTGKPLLVAALWPDEGNYARLCVISADYMPPTLAEFQATLFRRIAEKGLADANLVKVEFNPDELVRWCRDQGRPIDTKAREAYAAINVAAALERTERNRASGQRDN